MNGEQELPPTETVASQDPTPAPATTGPTPRVSDVVTVNIDLSPALKVSRPLIVTSVNKDGSVNGRVILEPGDAASFGPRENFLTNVVLS